ncbi:MAG: DivIVA domain-containing protein [Clostridia bacterium]|nr:DivIVA domain-containing protein [Clostridia bacterium]
MDSITEFKREFSRTMRGYSPAEVNEAMETLISYGAELESANAEFAEVNTSLLAQNEELLAKLEDLQSQLDALRSTHAETLRELDAYRVQWGEAKTILGKAQAQADALRADAESAVADSAARCDAEEKRYAALTRRTVALTESVRALYAEQMRAIDALAEKIVLPDDDVQPIARPTVRRAAMAAAAVEAEPDEPVTPQAIPRIARRPAAAPVAISEVSSDAAELFKPTAAAAEEAPTQQFTLPSDAESMKLDAAKVDSVYRPAQPTALKITRDKDSAAAPSHNFTAVRRTLDEIGSKLK